MKAKSLNCYKCGGNLDVNDSMFECTCNFCNSVNYLYELHEEYKKDIKSGETILNNLKEYDEAVDYFKKMLETYPNSAECWALLIDSFTHDYKYLSMPGNLIGILDSYLEIYKSKEYDEKKLRVNIFKVLSFKIKIFYRNISYMNKNKSIQEIMNLVKEIDSLGLTYDEIVTNDNEIFSYIRKIKDKKSFRKVINKNLTPFKLVMIILFLYLSLVFLLCISFMNFYG